MHLKLAIAPAMAASYDWKMSRFIAGLAELRGGAAGVKCGSIQTGGCRLTPVASACGDSHDCGPVRAVGDPHDDRWPPQPDLIILPRHGVWSRPAPNWPPPPSSIPGSDTRRCTLNSGRGQPRRAVVDPEIGFTREISGFSTWRWVRATPIPRSVVICGWKLQFIYWYSIINNRNCGDVGGGGGRDLRVACSTTN